MTKYELQRLAELLRKAMNYACEGTSSLRDAYSDAYDGAMSTLKLVEEGIIKLEEPTITLIVKG